MTKLLDACAHDLMDTAPKIVQSIRVEMRRRRGTDLSIVQFRTLRFIQSQPEAALTELAEHLGLTPPTVSKLVDGLVRQALVVRSASQVDRRRIELALTPNGEVILNSARAGARASLAERLSGLTNDDLHTVQRALEILKPLFE